MSTMIAEKSVCGVVNLNPSTLTKMCLKVWDLINGADEKILQQTGELEESFGIDGNFDSDLLHRAIRYALARAAK